MKLKHFARLTIKDPKKLDDPIIHQIPTILAKARMEDELEMERRKERHHGK